MNKILTEKSYDILQEVPQNLNLFTTVVIYYTGDYWKCIPIHDILPYMVLHDKYIDMQSNKEQAISLIICPYSLLCCVVDDIMYPNEVINGVMTFKNKDNLIFDFTNNKSGEKIKKRETYIKKLRNVFSEYNDILYVKIKEKNNKKVLPVSYYKDLLDENKNIIEIKKIHPKTLVHVIEYSNSAGDNKYTIVIGKKASKRKAYGYNSEFNKFDEYLKEIESELKFRDGFVYQMIYYKAIQYFKNKKVIKL
jgi:hypothetical protein